MLLSPIIQAYCKTGIDEYCKDSAQILYLIHLENWKHQALSSPYNQNTAFNCDIFIVAADILGLYPNISCKVLELALKMP